MERIAAGQPPLIFGDGTQTMDFVHVHDIARANILAAQSDVTDEVFNVASGTETSLIELADALLTVDGLDLQPEYGRRAQGQPGAAAPGRHRARPRDDARLRGRRSASTRACASWSTGGSANATTARS